MQEREAENWLSIQEDLGRARNTVLAYRRALDDYFGFCAHRGVPAQGATREHLALYVRSLTGRPAPGRSGSPACAPRPGLANATIRQRLTAVRLYHDHLVEEGARPDNPVGRGRYTRGGGFGGARPRALVPRYETLPWIPNDGEWRAVLEAAKAGPPRDRFMLALAYDAGLRREELRSLATGDLDPANRLLHVRAETTKGRRARVVPYSVPTAALLSACGRRLPGGSRSASRRCSASLGRRPPPSCWSRRRGAMTGASWLAPTSPARARRNGCTSSRCPGSIGSTARWSGSARTGAASAARLGPGRPR